MGRVTSHDGASKRVPRRRRALLSAAIALALPCSIASADIFEWEWVDPNNLSLGKRMSSIVVPGGVGVSVPYSPSDQFIFPPIDLTKRDLTKAYLIGSYPAYHNFAESNLTNADFTNADLSRAIFGEYQRLFAWPPNSNPLSAATLSGTTFTGANINHASFKATTDRGFTAQQLYGTASYQARDLRNVDLGANNLTGWNFSDQKLFGSDFSAATLSHASFVGALITEVILPDVFYTYNPGTKFRSTTARGFTAQQLYDTASYQSRSLMLVDLSDNDLNGWNFAAQDMSYASLEKSTLSGSNFAGATIEGINLANTTARGFTLTQLYATASYQARSLRGVALAENDLSGWDFAQQNLTDAGLRAATLTSANLTGAELRGASFYGSDLSNANFTGARIKGAGLDGAINFTPTQLYSTADYQNRDLQETRLGTRDLSGWDFSNQNLTGAGLDSATLTDADFTGAIVNNTWFDHRGVTGLTFTQLQSTASYQNRDLRGIRLDSDPGADQWDLSNQDMTYATFGGKVLRYANLRNTNLTGASLQTDPTGADFTGADISQAQLFNYSFEGSLEFTQAQLQSTASYQKRDLRGVGFQNRSWSGWNLSEQDLSYANFSEAEIIGTDFTRSDLRGAYIPELASAITTNAILPDGTIANLNLTAGKTLRIRDYDAAPGIWNQPTLIHVTSEMNAVAGSTISILLDNLTWGSTISFDVGIPANLGGTLLLGTEPHADLASLLGTSWQLFDWTGVSPTGTFTIASGDPNLVWDTSQLYSTGYVTLVAIPEPGMMLLASIGVAAALGRRRRV